MSELTTVAVRLLREFTAKADELDLHFTLLPTAHQDMMPHSAATSRRDLHYQKKCWYVVLIGTCACGAGPMAKTCN